MDNASIVELKQLLSTPKRVVITTHMTPDGDAMGSSLGLAAVLQDMGHEVQVITPNSYPKFLHWLPGNDSVLIYEHDPKSANSIIANAEMVFCLDFNDLGRIGELGNPIAASGVSKVMIDHHPEPTGFADFSFSETAACSTAELVYVFFEMLGVEHLLSKEIGDCLYTGIMTDTLSFRVDTTSAKTHQIIAKLIEAGAEGPEIHRRVYDNYSHDRLRLLGYSLNKKLQVFPEYRTAIIHLSLDELKEFNYKIGDTEGFVNYGLSIDGVCFAAFIMERKAEVKMSLRSSGSFSVNELARTHFNGGGHRNAAGGRTESTLNDTVQQLIDLLPQYKEALISS